ncbi:MAG: cupin domain-containing protein [Akkermansiaceae bacterium]|nr:cupin domain-containing protein [Verrucomicrobiales bacterium]
MLTRRDLIVAAVTLSLAVTAIAVAQTTTRPLMQSRVFNWSGMKVSPTPTGERRQLFDTPTANLARFECHITTLNPGEAPHAGHKHPEEEMMIVKEGLVEAIQNGQTNLVEVGGIIFCASNEMHGLRNAGTNRATYFVFKWFPHDLGKEKP